MHSAVLSVSWSIRLPLDSSACMLLPLKLPQGPLSLPLGPLTPWAVPSLPGVLLGISPCPCHLGLPLCLSKTLPLKLTRHISRHVGLPLCHLACSSSQPLGTSFALGPLCLPLAHLASLMDPLPDPKTIILPLRNRKKPLVLALKVPLRPSA